MPSDDKRRNQNGDLSADELLALLHQSMDDSKEQVKQKIKAEDKALQIDDSVFAFAEDEFHRNNRENLEEDELDIDALVEQYRRDHADDVYLSEEGSEEAEEREEDLFAEPEGEELPVEEAEAPAVEDPVIEEETVSEAEDEAFGSEELTEPEVSEIPEIPEADEPAEEYPEDAAEAFAEPSFPDEPEAMTAEEWQKDAAPGLSYETYRFGDLTDGVEELTIDPMDELVEEQQFSFEEALRQVLPVISFDDSEEEDEPSLTADSAFSETLSTDGSDETEEDGNPYAEAASEIEDNDQTDLNLMLAFGMQEELKDQVGEEKAAEMADEIEQRQKKTTKEQNDSRKVEFTNRNQVGDFMGAYQSRYYLLLIRLVASVLFGVAIFLLENYAMLGITLPAFMNPAMYPVVYAMIDLQLVVFCGAMVSRELAVAFTHMKKHLISPETVTLFMLVMSVIYTFASSLIAPFGGYRLYNLPVALCAIFSLIYELFHLRREIFAFRIVASEHPKFVISKVSGATDTLERDAFREFIPEDSSIVRVIKADFVENFFAHQEDKKASNRLLRAMIPLSLLIAVCFYVLTSIKYANAYTALTMAYIAFTLVLPLTTFLVRSLPFYRASKNAFADGGAILGEEALKEYAGSSVISFEDREVFPAKGVKVTSVKVFGNNRIDEVLYYLASSFGMVGGPLSDALVQATTEIGHSDDVELVSVEDDGFVVSVDGVQTYVGRATFMERRDFDLPYDPEDQQVETTTTLGILYVAYEGQLAAKLYVQYKLDSDFVKILDQLYKTGMCIGIKSFDPCIDDTMLTKKLKSDKYPIKVIRSKTVEDIPHEVDRVDSGLVSCRSVKSLLRAITLCGKVNNVVKTSRIIKILSIVLGVFVAGFIFALNGSLSVTSLYLAIYQLIWMIPIFLIARFSI